MSPLFGRLRFHTGVPLSGENNIEPVRDNKRHRESVAMGTGSPVESTEKKQKVGGYRDKDILKAPGGRGGARQYQKHPGNLWLNEIVREKIREASQEKTSIPTKFRNPQRTIVPEIIAKVKEEGRRFLKLSKVNGEDEWVELRDKEAHDMVRFRLRDHKKKLLSEPQTAEEWNIDDFCFFGDRDRLKALSRMEAERYGKHSALLEVHRKMVHVLECGSGDSDDKKLEFCGKSFYDPFIHGVRNLTPSTGPPQQYVQPLPHRGILRPLTEPLQQYVQPRPQDILLGSEFTSHEGNKWLRQKVSEKQQEYYQTEDTRANTSGYGLDRFKVQESVQKVKNEGGRFLKPVQVGERMIWVELPEREACDVCFRIFESVLIEECATANVYRMIKDMEAQKHDERELRKKFRSLDSLPIANQYPLGPDVICEPGYEKHCGNVELRRSLREENSLTLEVLAMAKASGRRFLKQVRVYDELMWVVVSEMEAHDEIDRMFKSHDRKSKHAIARNRWGMSDDTIPYRRQ